MILEDWVFYREKTRREDYFFGPRSIMRIPVKTMRRASAGPRTGWIAVMTANTAWLSAFENNSGLNTQIIKPKPIKEKRNLCGVPKK
jgi:hypothetical protein